jgi:type II secretory pathway component PulC
MSILSLILIILVHYLFTFFKTNLTIPKVKDLVNKPQKQYEALFDTMKESNIKQQPIPTETNENMKDELKNYLKELSNKPMLSNSNTHNMNMNATPNVNQMDGIMTAESLGSSAYSTF